MRRRDVQSLKVAFAILAMLGGVVAAPVWSMAASAPSAKGVARFRPPERWNDVIITVTNPDAKCVDERGNPTGEALPIGRNLTAKQNSYGIVLYNTGCFLFQKDVTFGGSSPCPSAPRVTDPQISITGAPLGLPGPPNCSPAN